MGGQFEGRPRTATDLTNYLGIPDRTARRTLEFVEKEHAVFRDGNHHFIDPERAAFLPPDVFELYRQAISPALPMFHRAWQRRQAAASQSRSSK
jgi:hypothetical protein